MTLLSSCIWCYLNAWYDECVKVLGIINFKGNKVSISCFRIMNSELVGNLKKMLDEWNEIQIEYLLALVHTIQNAYTKLSLV